MSLFPGISGPRQTPGAAAWGSVPMSSEINRVLAIPRRLLDLDQLLIEIDDRVISIPDVTDMFRRAGGAMTLRPIQSACLVEAAIADGGLFQVGVGDGKTLVTLALPEVLNASVAVLLVPPNLKAKTARDMARYSQHFELPLDRLELVTYWELSNADLGGVLERLKPDLIIADECHNLRRPGSARTKRFTRYMRKSPHCRFVGLSGSLAKHSVADYQHLAEHALRKNSPIASGFRELQDWCGALDSKPLQPMKPGALLRFCREGEDVRDGFKRRLRDTRGIVVSSQSKIDAALHIRRLDVPVPPALEALRAQVIKTWALADEEFQDQLMLTKTLRQLAAGFYYRWQWPSGVADQEWITARKGWHKEVRDYLAHSSREGMDSPELLRRAADSGRWKSEWWAAWKAVKDRPEPPLVPVWVSEFLIDAAAAWVNTLPERESGEEGGGAIVWYEHRAVGAALERRLGVPRYGAGTDAEPSRAPVIICSGRAQGTGKNLQGAYSRNLLTTMPSSGDSLEQLIGRTHREGQPQDEVTVDWFGHVPEMLAAWSNCLEDAKRAEKVEGSRQKILYADVV